MENVERNAVIHRLLNEDLPYIILFLTLILGILFSVDSLMSTHFLLVLYFGFIAALFMYISLILSFLLVVLILKCIANRYYKKYEKEILNINLIRLQDLIHNNSKRITEIEEKLKVMK